MAATPEHAARVLGLTVDATLEDVRLVRRALALKYHPDRGGDPARASRHMARINAAVDTLVAHIQERRVVLPKPQPTADELFARRRKAAERRARAAYAKSQPQQTKTTTTADQPSEAQAEAAPSQAAHVALGREQISRSDLGLIRLAAASYRTVLDRISKIDPGPTVDVTALAYPAA